MELLGVLDEVEEEVHGSGHIDAVGDALVAGEVHVDDIRRLELSLAAGGKTDVIELEHFRRLLAILDLSPGLADALADWIDADGVPQPNDGAEDSYYGSLQPPYLAANRPLTDLSELALVRGFARHEMRTLGNFWVDMTRATVYVLLPISAVAALFLCSQGVIQNLKPYTTVTTLEGAKQVIALGPVASQEAIKQLGTNGGGFFNANSAHPFENPSAVRSTPRVMRYSVKSCWVRPYRKFKTRFGPSSMTSSNAMMRTFCAQLYTLR